LKQFSNDLQPYREVAKIIREIIEAPEKSPVEDRRLFKHVLYYAQFQFGDRLPGKSYRQRANGSQITNWAVDFGFFHEIYSRIGESYANDTSLGRIVQANNMIPYVEKQLEVLTPWSVLIDSDCHIDSLNKDEINQVLILLSDSARVLASLYLKKEEFNASEVYCKRALSYASKYEGKLEEKTTQLCRKTTQLCRNYTAYYNLRMRQADFFGAKKFAEEAYNCCAEAYNPVHPEVQKAAGNLIGVLGELGDFEKAEIFAQLTLDRYIFIYLNIHIFMYHIFIYMYQNIHKYINVYIYMNIYSTALEIRRIK
jgi:hypothetical protein